MSCWCKEVFSFCRPNKITSDSGMMSQYVCIDCEADTRWKKIPARWQMRLIAYSKMLTSANNSEDLKKRKIDMAKLISEGGYCVSDIPLDKGSLLL